MNVTIIQEVGSKLGTVRYNKLQGIRQVTPADDQTLKGFTHPQQVIWCKFSDDKPPYPIALFPNNQLRDKALEYILMSSSKVVVLDYNKFFCYEVVDLTIVRSFLLRNNYTLPNTLGQAIRHIKFNKPDADILSLDAFASMNNPQFNSLIKLGSPCPIANVKIADVWAKCLHIDSCLLDQGFTKAQVFRSLISINNENFKGYPH